MSTYILKAKDPYKEICVQFHEPVAGSNLDIVSYYRYTPWPNKSGLYTPPEPKGYADQGSYYALCVYLRAYADLGDNEVQGMLKRLGYGT